MSEPQVQDLKFGLEERARAIFEPDILLASQYGDRVKGRREYDPERRLMYAVLEIAVNDYASNAGAADPKRQALFRDVEEWIESRDASWLYSFENICNVLDLDPDYLRGGLYAWKRRVAGKRPTDERPSAPAGGEDELRESA